MSCSDSPTQQHGSPSNEHIPSSYVDTPLPLLYAPINIETVINTQTVTPIETVTNIDCHKTETVTNTETVKNNYRDSDKRT